MKSSFTEKQKAKKFYDAWRKEKTFCPALNCFIRVSLKGWRHITGATGAKKRPFNDIYRRLKLLPYAKELILKSTTIQNVMEKHGHKFYALDAVMEVKEKGKKELRKLRVVIYEDQKKEKVFLSIMSKNKKSSVPHA